MQSFLGSLNYFSRLLEDYAIYASILNKLRKINSHAMRNRESVIGDRKEEDPEKNRWDRAHLAFSMLKHKIAAAPILRQFDPSKEPVITVYAIDWAISASLVQDYEGVFMPVTFTSRTLKVNEVHYGTVTRKCCPS